MTIDEAREHVGEVVIYRPEGDLPESGVITSVGEHLVYVRYDGDGCSQATYPADLTLADVEETCPGGC